jgi:hypothetical protein
LVGHKAQGVRLAVTFFLFCTGRELSPLHFGLSFSLLQYSNIVCFYLRGLSVGTNHVNWRFLGACFFLALIWALLLQRV